MRSWPAPYLPPALSQTAHPPLTIVDSYTAARYQFAEKLVTSYVCGITPYDATHLGHAATYIAYDLMHRYLMAAGHEVVYVQNVTDIDDPLLERAHRDQLDWETLADSQVDLFRSDMTALRVIPPRAYRGVVESMPEIIDAIEKLVARGVTYSIDGDIYLDIATVPGALTELPISLLEATDIFRERGGDPDRTSKRNSLDTLLWLAARPDEPSWPAPFGAGRPGWHIECLAIAISNLPGGQENCLTLQGGGSDLRFPHHYMTNVQARALTGKDFAAVYSHAGMIGLAGEKMSKSLGNLLFVSKLMAGGMSANEIRLALLSRHYRADTMWDESRFLEATARIESWSSALSREEVAPTAPVVAAMVAALADDLNTESAISEVDRWAQATKQGASGGSAGEISRALDLYLGIAL